jgi:hypothetical protein
MKLGFEYDWLMIVMMRSGSDVGKWGKFAEDFNR